MRPHDVDDRIAAELSQVVNANDRIFVVAPHVIHPRFEFDEIVDKGAAISRPVHLADNSAQRESSLVRTAGQLLKLPKHTVWIKPTVRQVSLHIPPKLQLSAPL